MKRIVFTVTNDLCYDQRMERICSALAENGYDVCLIGRADKNSNALDKRSYEQQRIICSFEKGKLFYIEYNFKLLWKLLFTKTDIICSIDLDSILPGDLASLLRGKTIVYDAHEYFTEMEEVVSRPIIKMLWLNLEKFVLKRVKYAYTISDGYAQLFRKNYGKKFSVIRNVPRINPLIQNNQARKKVVQYQGILNIGRGLEEAIKAVSSLDDFELHIYGDGPQSDFLKQLARNQNAGSKVQFMGMVSPEVLKEKTPLAWVGLTLFSSKGLHHQHSLANRFFDYFHAGIPQIAVGYSEYKSFNENNEVALLIPEMTAMAVRVSLLNLERDTELYNRLQHNCQKAAEANNWQEESKKLLAFYENL
jgi:glycosyltransferase involved in cell wall biosynthesis